MWGGRADLLASADALETGPLMKPLFAVALGILTAIGGFLDIGDLVTNAVVGSRFGLALAWVVPSACSASACSPQMSGRVAAVSGRADVRTDPGAARAASAAGESGRVVLHQPDDADRRDRRCGAGPANWRSMSAACCGSRSPRSPSGW